jgi:thymidylate synthase
MSLTSSRARLSALTKTLLVEWDQTKETWRDAKSQEFEHRYMEELRSNVERASIIIDQLDKLVTKVRSDCE